MIGNNDRIKFIETSGKKYSDFYKNHNPFRKRCEEKEKCLLCETSEGKDDCKLTNIGYSIFCRLCKDRKKSISYHGESARSCYLRGAEHVKELERRSKTSVLYKHVRSDHKDEEDQVKFGMKMVGRFTSALGRIIDESRRIRNTPPHELLNSKSEFHGPVIKRKVYEN